MAMNIVQEGDRFLQQLFDVVKGVVGEPVNKDLVGGMVGHDGRTTHAISRYLRDRQFVVYEEKNLQEMLVSITAIGIQHLEELKTKRAVEPGTVRAPRSSSLPTVFETAFNAYERGQLIGGGGSGQVYEAKDSDGRVFALKCLSPDRVSTEKTKRFKNEMAFCGRELHPRIVRVVDSGYVQIGGKKCPFYVMERFESTLRSHITNRLAPEIALRVFANLLDAVEAAHLAGVWHRDLKPENVLCRVSPDDLVVADFGIAHFAEELLATTVVTQENAKLANFAYAAPEQRQKGTPVDSRADIFALGLILNELFTGELAHGKNHSTISSVAPQHGYLDALVDVMLQQEPARRPSTINDVKSVLIGHRNMFVARQELLKEKKIVVPAASAVDFVDIKPSSVDWSNGQLMLTVDRQPPPGWVAAFANPRENHSSLLGKGPDAFRFTGASAVISAASHEAQAIVNHFKEYVAMANRRYVAEQRRSAEEKARRDRDEQERRVKQAEERERIVSSLKL